MSLTRMAVVSRINTGSHSPGLLLCQGLTLGHSLGLLLCQGLTLGHTHQDCWCLSPGLLVSIYLSICTLTRRVLGAPSMISQPAASISETSRKPCLDPLSVTIEPRYWKLPGCCCKSLCVHADLGEAVGVSHHLGLLSTDFHSAGRKGFVEAVHNVG